MAKCIIQELILCNATVKWFLAKTTITTTRTRGLRGAVYDMAGKSGAFHSNLDKTSISYNSPQLSVCLLFAQPAECVTFQAKLEEMVWRVFDIEATIQHTRSYEAVNWSSALQGVLASDYISADNPNSDEYSVFSNRLSPDAVEVTLEMQPKLWENATLSCFLGRCKGERCHLMSQISYTQHASNENNILIMSADNHTRFDGYNPKMSIKWIGETDRVTTVNGEDLTYCEIVIICVNDEVYRCVGEYRKLGTDANPAARTYTTSVAVPNPLLFKQYLTFKYLETRGLQESDQSEKKIAMMRRVRVEVVERMRQEFGNLLTIDLDLKPKNKRNIAAMEGDG